MEVTERNELLRTVAGQFGGGDLRPVDWQEGRSGLTSEIFVLVGVHCLMLIYTT